MRSLPAAAEDGFDVGHHVVMRRCACRIVEDDVNSVRAVIGIVVERDVDALRAQPNSRLYHFRCLRKCPPVQHGDNGVAAAVTKQAGGFLDRAGGNEFDPIIAASTMNGGVVSRHLDVVVQAIAVDQNIFLWIRRIEIEILDGAGHIARRRDRSSAPDPARDCRCLFPSRRR